MTAPEDPEVRVFKEQDVNWGEDFRCLIYSISAGEVLTRSCSAWQEERRAKRGTPFKGYLTAGVPLCEKNVLAGSENALQADIVD